MRRRHCVVSFVLFFSCLLSGNLAAQQESITALYRVDKIQKIAKKTDDQCIDNATTPCPRMAYWKVYYKALDLAVPQQEHIISLDSQLPQIGAVKQLTIVNSEAEK